MTTERGHFRTLGMGFDEALARLPEALKAEGFGIVTQIDMQETFKAKLGVDFRRYRILGACNPKLALAALTESPELGVLLPCNVVVYEAINGKAVVGAIDPLKTIGAAGEDTKVGELAHDVDARLRRAIDAIA